MPAPTYLALLVLVAAQPANEPTKLDRRGPQMGRPFGTTSIIRTVEGEDWSDYNRVSFWVYPDLPGFHTISLLVQLRNDAKIRLPGPG